MSDNDSPSIPAGAANPPARVRILIQGFQLRTEDIEEGDTVASVTQRLQEDGIPVDRIETFYVNAVPARGSDAVVPGSLIVGAPKQDGGNS